MAAISATQSNSPYTPSALDDQASARSAQTGFTRATTQLASDQQPRGSAVEIAADQAAVQNAQDAIQQATKRLRTDGAQPTLVNVVA